MNHGGHKASLFETSDITAALRAGEVGIWEWNVEGAPSRVCPNAARMFGFPDRALAGDLKPETFIARVLPEDRAPVRRLVGEAVSRGGPFDIRFRMVPSDGHPSLLLCHGTIELDERGSMRRARGIVIDRSRPRSEMDVLEDAESGLDRLARIALEAWTSLDMLDDEDQRDIEPAIRTLLVLIGRRLARTASPEPIVLRSLRASLHS